MGEWSICVARFSRVHWHGCGGSIAGKIDESTEKTGRGKTNGFDTESVTIKGKDEDGPCTITILLVSIKDKVLVITYWFTDANLDERAKEVEEIRNSLKASS